MMTLYDFHRLIRWYLSTGPARFHVLDVRILGSVCGNSEIVPGTADSRPAIARTLRPCAEAFMGFHSHRQSGGLRLLLRQNRAYIGSTARLWWVNTGARLLHTFTRLD